MLPENVKIRKYPTDFMMRYDSFACDYCDIALTAYYDAMKLHETMVAAEWYYGPIDHHMPDRMRKTTMVAIVFTAMCAEAFINDYLSIRLGDEQFYQYCDGHRYSEKLEMVMVNILKEHDYQALEWHQRVSELFKKRNKLVHNVSKAMTVARLVRTTEYENWRLEAEDKIKLKKVQEEFPLDQEEQLHAFMCRKDPDDCWVNPKPTVADATERKYLKEQLECARSGLNALSDMLRKIEKLDPDSRAFEYTFYPLALLWGEDDERVIREKVFPQIGLSFTAEDLERVVIARAKAAQKDL